MDFTLASLCEIIYVVDDALSYSHQCLEGKQTYYTMDTYDICPDIR